jgi:hypothetical protein
MSGSHIIDDFCALATARKTAGVAFPPPLVNPRHNQQTPWLSYADAGIWLIDENTQSGWRMIV